MFKIQTDEFIQILHWCSEHRLSYRFIHQDVASMKYKFSADFLQSIYVKN